jgi:arylsulfatase A-like enzyme
MAQWKGKIPAGKTYENPVIQLDILPTAIAAAGGKVEPDWKLDGVDLLPYLTGEAAGKPHETFYWRFGQQMAIRHGDWKLVVGNGGSGKPELYNLAADISEATDLAAKNPEKVQELQDLWDGWNAEQAPASYPKEDGAAKKKKKAKQKA